MALLHSLLDGYSLERYEPFYLPNYGLDTTTTVLLKNSFDIKNPTKFDMQLNKDTKKNQEMF